jgi:hypothetical protein
MACREEHQFATDPASVTEPPKKSPHSRRTDFSFLLTGQLDFIARAGPWPGFCEMGRLFFPSVRPFGQPFHAIFDDEMSALPART